MDILIGILGITIVFLLIPLIYAQSLIFYELIFGVIIDPEESSYPERSSCRGSLERLEKNIEWFVEKIEKYINWDFTNLKNPPNFPSNWKGWIIYTLICALHPAFIIFFITMLLIKH